MQKLREQIPWRSNGDGFENLPDTASVIRAMSDDMQEHFFTKFIPQFKLVGSLLSSQLMAPCATHC
jgi:hypothetical protein